ncbi:DUF423 domain-containing protein [Teredinibacter waterburyi]|uniref:DUF423 domain-containing protein n=1 Tax=Teredinibacter waterburyi TaxID=1500538 RepID=UPI00165F047D|nr:DUF423 domain-containing protein [Teredinibacter waterburyi]
MYSKLILLFAAANGAVAVVLGAFGAHALKGRLADNLLSAWHTAVQYHFYHVLALMAVGILLQQGAPQRWLHWSALGFVGGLIFFCGSLYGLALGGPRWLGPVTPLGGLSFILGWTMLVVAIGTVKKVG